MAKAGAEIVAASVDSEARCAALARRWHLPFVVASDPGGQRILQPLELYNPDDRGGIALPALVLISSGGDEALRQPSRDFADRVHDDDVLGKLEAHGYDAIEAPEEWSPSVEVPEEGSDPVKGAFPTKAFVPLMNGNLFGALGIAQRLEHAPSVTEVKRHAAMAKSFLGAWKERQTS